MQIKAPKDFWAGLMFIALGTGFALVARNYEMGTASNMKAAYFPTILGIVLACLGLILLVRSFATAGEPVPRFYLKTGFILLASVVIFGVLLRPIGLVAATLSLVIVSSFGSEQSQFKQTLLLAAGLAAFSVLVFHYGLGLPFRIWPWE